MSKEEDEEEEVERVSKRVRNPNQKLNGDE